MMRTFQMPRITRLRAMLRGIWPDANPLRRSSDRVETWVLLALGAIFMAAAPVVAVLAAGHVYGAGLRAEHSSHLVTVTLIGHAQRGNGLRAAAPVTWIASDGVSHVGRVGIAPGARAGSAARAWADGAGRLVGEPLHGAGLARAAAIAALFAVVVLAALLIGTATIARWVLGRRRMTAWEAEWRLTEPRWVRRSEI